MARIYTATAEVSNVTAAIDLMEVNAPSDSAIMILSAVVSQSSEEGDAEAEMLQFSIGRASGSAGSGGSSATPQAHDEGDPASGATVESGNTTRAGTNTLIRREAANVQAGWFYTPVPEERIIVSPGGDPLIFGMEDTPADAVNFKIAVTFAEIGGA